MKKFQSILGVVELTNERKSHILTAHPELKNYFEKFIDVLKNPDEIRISKIDKKVLLFYKYFATIQGGKYLSITVKIDKRNFVLTAYITDKIRAGVKYETEKNIV